MAQQPQQQASQVPAAQTSQPSGVDPVTTGLSRLNWEHGVLGIFCVLLIFALVVNVRWQRADNAARLASAEKSDDRLGELNKQLTELVVATNGRNGELRQEMAKLSERVEDHGDDLKEMRASVEDLRTKNIEALARNSGVVRARS